MTKNDFIILRVALLSAIQALGRRQEGRVPEPECLTEAPGEVLDYDRVWSTNMSVVYGYILESLSKFRGARGGAALDLCCGPGHLTIALARELALNKIVGLDLSEPMLAVARKNAAIQGVERTCGFQKADVTDLSGFEDNSMDVSLMTNGAHHMPGIEMAARAFQAMDRVTRPDGCVFIWDLARLRTARVTNVFLDIFGDRTKKEAPFFYNDFRNSMFAAWTPSEIGRIIPPGLKRQWYLVVARPLPFMQMIVGLPRDRSEKLVRQSNPMEKIERYVPQAFLPELKLMRLFFALGRVTRGPEASTGIRT